MRVGEGRGGPETRLLMKKLGVQQAGVAGRRQREREAVLREVLFKYFKL